MQNGPEADSESNTLGITLVYVILFPQKAKDSSITTKRVQMVPGMSIPVPSSKTQCCKCPFLNRVSQQTLMATSSLKDLSSAENSKLAWGTARAALEESFLFLLTSVFLFMLSVSSQKKKGKAEKSHEAVKVWHSRLLKMKNATWERSLIRTLIFTSTKWKFF